MTAERIAVVRALPGLGDVLCGVPALRALRAGFPRARVTLIGLPASGWIPERLPGYVDELLPFPGFPGLPELPVDPAAIVAFLAEAQRRRFDLAIQLHGAGPQSNAFAELLGAGRTAGVRRPGAVVADPELFVDWRDDEPEPRWPLRVLSTLGVAPAGEQLEFPVTAADREELATLSGDLAPGSYACLHPGSSLPDRRWPADRYAAVADALTDRGLRPVLTGTAGEAAVVAAVRERSRGGVLDLCGRTSLGALAALLEGAAVVVCNDTGTSHLAAALRTPSAVVFTVTDPARWAPLDRERHLAVGPPAPAVEEVLEAIDRLTAGR